jgi:hypothetical protein
MMETWLLLFVLGSGDAFVGGEYLTMHRCRTGARHQVYHWRAHYHDPKIRWKCRKQEETT